MVLEIAKMYQALLELTRVEQQHRIKSNASELLAKLEPVDAADINAQNSNGCLAGTRVQVLKELSNWSHDKCASRIYWLNGMAGIGKSAIARSFCHNLLQEGLLGGSFFCSRQRSSELAEVSRIIPTLAASLATRDEDYSNELLAELDRERFSSHWNLGVQIQRLLHNPLAHLGSSNFAGLIFVLDALDECSDENATRDLVLKLVEVTRCLPVRFFLTSRPEPHIRRLLEHMDLALGKVLRLHDIEKDIIEADIHLYITRGLVSMRKSLPAASGDWPPEADVQTLTHLSGSLFIYAFTALTYVERSPIQRLAKLTANGAIMTTGKALTKPLDDIYNLILKDATDQNVFDDDEIDQTRRILSIIVFLRQSLTVTALASLLGMTNADVKASLDRLYAVIYVPVQDDRGAISTFHASFGDFLKTPTRAPEDMHQPIREEHMYLSDACVRMLSEKLCQRIILVITARGGSRDDALCYASLHWAHHAIRSGVARPHIYADLKNTFRMPKLTYWMELLSAFGFSSQTRSIIEEIVDSPNGDASESQLIHYFCDALGYVDYFHPASELSPRFIREDSPTIS